MQSKQRSQICTCLAQYIFKQDTVCAANVKVITPGYKINLFKLLLKENVVK